MGDGVAAIHLRVVGGDERDRRGVAAFGRGGHCRRGSDDAPVEQAVQQRPVVEETGFQRCEQVTVGCRRQRVAGGVVLAVGAVQVGQDDDAVARRHALHLAGEQALVPDVRKRVGQQHRLEPRVGER